MIQVTRRSLLRGAAAAGLAAGSAREARAAENVIYWHHFTSQEEFAGLKKVMELFKQRFPDVALTQENIPNPEYMTKFTAAVMANSRPDVTMIVQERLADMLAFFAPGLEVVRFPAWDCLPYDRVSPNAAVVSERIAALARLLEKRTAPLLVLTTVNALVQRVPPRSVFAGKSLSVATGGVLAPEKLAAFLQANG